MKINEVVALGNQADWLSARKKSGCTCQVAGSNPFGTPTGMLSPSIPDTDRNNKLKTIMSSYEATSLSRKTWLYGLTDVDRPREGNYSAGSLYRQQHERPIPVLIGRMLRLPVSLILVL